MTLTLGMFDKILDIDAMLSPLIENGELKADHVTLLVREQSMDYAKTRTQLFKDHLEPPRKEFLDDLLDRGVPRVEALFYEHGIRAGKEVVMVESDPKSSLAISAYLKQGPRSSTHGMSSQDRTSSQEVHPDQVVNDIMDGRSDTQRETVDMVEEETMHAHRANRWDDSYIIK